VNTVTVQSSSTTDKGWLPTVLWI